MENLVGQTLNRYRILSLLGEGGMGAVYKGFDATLQRDVAVKVLHGHYARRSDFQERFLQEARTAARLDHPNIVQVHDFGQDRSFLYIVMKFISGDNLERMLRDLRSQQKWIILIEACELIRQISQALDYAHRQGVLHRDIKPGNIMIEPEPSAGLPYRPVVTDLGLAKLAAGGVVTQDGTSMGTPAYMSPEQALGQAMDARSDVYSLGILFFELVTGQLPFPARSLSDAIQYHVNTSPPDPHVIRADIPPEIESIVLRCLQKSPDERYPSASALASVIAENAALSKFIQTDPSPIAIEVSLLTQYQQSVFDSQDGSILLENNPASEVLEDRIQVVAKDKTVQSVLIKHPRMMIGRDSDNDIVLEDRKASRHHVRIEFDQNRYRIVDLNSTNGTMLADQRLPPGVAESWLPEKAMRIGDTWFRLLIARNQGIPATEPIAAAVGLEKTTEKIGNRGEAALAATLDVDHIVVEPGSGAQIQVTIENIGSSMDQVLLSVEGIPSSWVRTPAFPISLMPGESKDATIFLTPPRSAESHSGQFSVTIQARGQQTPNPINTYLSLSLSAFTSFESSLSPTHLRTGQTGHITLKNHGNASEQFSVLWHDPNHTLVFTPSQPAFLVPVGGEVAVEFQAEARQKNLISGAKRYPFTAQVHPASGAPQYLDAEVAVNSIIPTWIIPLVIVLCLGIGAVGLVIGSSLGYVSLFPTSTNLSEQTEIAVAVQQTNEASTATVFSLNKATQVSQSQASATANWLLNDDDKDGLSNEQEISLNTLPDKRDTDEDGLDDGEEINRRMTDPLNPDSDHDGLKMGTKSHERWILSDPDSDGDGIFDPQDLAPLQTSTATADLSATQNAAFLATQQQSASQTSEAQQTTASAAAQLTLSAADTANAVHAATLTAQAITRIAYVYDLDGVSANDFKTFLQAQGYSVELIKPESLQVSDLSIFRLILIGTDTGSTSTWGDAGGTQALALQSSGKPLLGIGEGGYAFFGKLGLSIGWGNGAHGSEERIITIDPSAIYWNSPIHVNIPGDKVISLYTNPGDYVGIYLPSPILDVEQIANIPGNEDYYPLVRESHRYALWGFSGTPSAMTNKGQRVFFNLLEAMIP